jgi:putative membrane protein
MERVAFNTQAPRSHLVLLALFLIVLVWSGIGPHDRFTWYLEVAPAVVGGIVLIAVYNQFRFTTLSYGLICLHAIVLCVGGHYTYAEMPLFNWLRDTFELSRNHYDRLGHFVQGFVPAIIAREVLLRTSPLRQGKWLAFLVICVCLSISAFYELIEWWVAVATGTAAEAFLGTQGDVWDSQWDMSLALAGAVVSLFLLSRRHDRALQKLIGETSLP